jgi:hypothetical protein
MDFVVYFFALCWGYRRNRLVAVGGIAVACLGISLALNKVPWLPSWFEPIPFMGFTLLSLLFVVLICYYILKALLTVTKRLLGKAVGHDPTQPN